MGQVGSVVSLAGKVVGIIDGAEHVLTAGSSIFEGELIKTAVGANIEIKFDDETVMSQGPGSELTIDSYVYNPNAPAQSSFLFKMAQGTYRMATGQIAEENPDGVRLESPLATIGIRGTTTISQILPNGQELHAAESLTGGRSILIADQFGNQQLISFPSGGVPMGPGQPMGAVFTVPQNVFNAIRASAPLTTQGEPPAPGAEGGDTPPDNGGDQGAGEDPGPSEVAADGDVPPDGAAGDGTGEGTGEGGGGEITGDAVAGGEDPLGGAGEALGDATAGPGLAGGLGGGGIGLIGGDPAQEFLGSGTGFFEGTGGGDGEEGGSGGGGSNQDLLNNFLNNSGGGVSGDGGGEDNADNPFNNTDDTVAGDTGNEDVIEVGNISIFLGTAGNDLLTGTQGTDLMYGFTGEDTLVGNYGIDVLNGGEGNDYLYGGTVDQTSANRLYALDTITHGSDTLDDGASAKIDGDGYADVVLVTHNGSSASLVWYETVVDSSTKAVTFTEHVIDDSLMGTTHIVAVGDVNNDGHADILVPHTITTEIMLYENSGNGSFGSATDTGIPVVNATNIALADVNHDGWADIVVRTADDLTWYANNGDGTFVNNGQTIASGLTAGDLIEVTESDSSGSYGNYAEIVTSYYDGSSSYSVKAFHYDGTWGHDVVQTTSSSPVVAVGKLNSDSVGDMVIADGSTLTAYTSGDNTAFVNSHGLGTVASGTVLSLAIANLSPHDTDPDILVGTTTGVYMYQSADHGADFYAVPLLTGLSNVEDVIFGDFDGGGTANDVAIHFSGSEQLVIYENLIQEAGLNTLDYSLQTHAVSINLNTGEEMAIDGLGYTDTLTEHDHFYLFDNAMGSSYNDSIVGNDFDNYISGLSGNDSITGALGNDTLYGNDGLDTIHGGMGNDSIDGGDGNDSLFGENHGDVIYGGAGDDMIDGGDGNDTIDGGIGDDTIHGGSGLDSISGGDGNDTIYGVTDSGSTNDELYGDTIDGGAGNDHLYGTNQTDHIYGGSGNDYLYGGSGSDTLNGGSGDDTFHYSYSYEGNDTVEDFSSGHDHFTFTSAEFGSLSTGTLSSNNFEVWDYSQHGNVHYADSGEATFSGSAGFVYEIADANATSGTLYYDSNGATAGGNAHIADVTSDAVLAHTDITIV